MLKLLQLPATISKIETKRNRSLRLQVNTQEDLSDEQMQKTMNNLQCYGHFCFLKDKQITKEDVINLPELPKQEKDEKSPSQRLRSRMFVYYSSINSDNSGFNDWYIKALDKIGDSYLNKVN